MRHRSSSPINHDCKDCVHFRSMSTANHKRGKKLADQRFNRIIENAKPELEDFFESVYERMKNLAIVRKPYKSRNNKELSVRPGEIFEILDDDGSWWCLRAPSGKTGHVPRQNLELILNPLAETNHGYDSSPEPIIVKVPVIVQSTVQRDEVKSETPPPPSSTTKKNQHRARTPTLQPDPVPQVKVEKIKETLKSPDPKSLKKLRKMRAATQKATKKLLAASVASTVSVSSLDSSSSSASSLSDNDSLYENALRKSQNSRTKAAAKKASPAPKPRVSATKHCCETIKQRPVETVHCCELVPKPRPIETIHCCEMVRCCHNHKTEPPPLSSSFNRGFDSSWRNQTYRPPALNRTTIKQASSPAKSEPRQKTPTPPPTNPPPPQQDKPPMIIFVETPNREPTPEPEIEESVPIQIMFTPSSQYNSQLTCTNQVSQYPQQPLLCYSTGVGSASANAQWPAAPYYMYT